MPEQGRTTQVRRTSCPLSVLCPECGADADTKLPFLRLTFPPTPHKAGTRGFGLRSALHQKVNLPICCLRYLKVPGHQRNVCGDLKAQGEENRAVILSCPSFASSDSSEHAKHRACQDDLTTIINSRRGRETQLSHSYSVVFSKSNSRWV